MKRLVALLERIADRIAAVVLAERTVCAFPNDTHEGDDS